MSMKDRSNEQFIATAVTGIGIGILFGEAINHIISKDISFLMKVGTCVGGSVLGLFTADKVNAWVQNKLDERHAKEEESEITE